MKRSKFSDTQIVSILKQAEAGMPVKEVCRQHQINSDTVCTFGFELLQLLDSYPFDGIRFVAYPAPATKKLKTRPCAGFFVSTNRSFDVRFTPGSGH